LPEILESPQVEPVKAPSALRLVGHETGFKQYSQVLRDRRPGDHRHGRSDLANGLWAHAEAIQDLSAAMAREGTADLANVCPTIRLPVSADTTVLSIFVNSGPRRKTRSLSRPP
jgi:hypothetical protein